MIDGRLSSSLGQCSLPRVQVLGYSFSLHMSIRLQHSRVVFSIVSFNMHMHRGRVSRHETWKRQTSATLFPLGCGCLRGVMLVACCCAWPLAAAALLRLRATLRLPCRRLVLPCSLGPVFVLLAIPTPARAGSEFGTGLLCWPPAAGLRKGRRAGTALGCRCPHCQPSVGFGVVP